MIAASSVVGYRALSCQSTDMLQKAWKRCIQILHSYSLFLYLSDSRHSTRYPCKSPRWSSFQMKQLKDETTSSPPPAKRQSLDGFLFSKDRYKLFVLAALLILAVWSMFTGTLTLKSTASDLAVSAFSSNPDDLDVLEVAEREKMVKNLWNVYIHGFGGRGNKIRLPRFWEEAFQAAYESLISDSPSTRDEAFTEIAKMSLSSLDLLPPPTHSTDAGETGKTAISGKLKTR